MVPGYVGRVSFTGDLGYEIWVTTDYQRALYDSLIKAGREHGLRLFGGRALNAMRIEKSFGTWAREYRPIYGPVRGGSRAFRRLQEGPTSSAVRRPPRRRRAAARCKLLMLQGRRPTDADAIGDEPIWHDGKAGRLGHLRALTGIASAPRSRSGYVPAALAEADAGFEIEIIGERRAAVRLNEPPSIRAAR